MKTLAALTRLLLVAACSLALWAASALPASAGWDVDYTETQTLDYWETHPPNPEYHGHSTAAWSREDPDQFPYVFNEIDPDGYPWPACSFLGQTQVHVVFRISWQGGGDPIGVTTDQEGHKLIKVRVKLWGAAGSYAEARYYQPDEESPPVLGSATAEAGITSDLGFVGPTQAYGTCPNVMDGDTDVQTLWEVRTLQLDENNEATTTLDFLAWVDNDMVGSYVLSEVDWNFSADVTVVKLVDPIAGGDPVMAGQNEYVYGNAELGGGDFPCVRIPCRTSVADGVGSTLTAAGVLDWSVAGKWLYPLNRLYPNYCGGTYLNPRCEDPTSPGTQFPDVGLVSGRADYLPVNNSDFGATTVTLSSLVANIDGPATGDVELFYPATGDLHPNPGHKETPNWYYYYYSQAYSPGGDYHSGASEYIYGYPGTIHIGDGAHGAWHFAVFHRDAAGKIAWAADDYLNVFGIHNFAFQVLHEAAHKRHYEDVSWTLAYDSWYPPAPGVDDDRDRVFDWDEEHLFGLGACPGKRGVEVPGA